MPESLTSDAALSSGDLSALGHPAPWLRDAADPERIAAALERGVPELANGELVLGGCEALRLRIKDDSCTALYRVAVSDPGTNGERDIELSGKLIPPGRRLRGGVEGGSFGSAAWACLLPDLRVRLSTTPEHDEALPALPQLTDRERARRLIERAVRGRARRYSGFRVRACRPHVMRYKRGSRCTVFYELELPHGAPAEWPNTVVAKTHHGDKGANAYGGMNSLWNSPLRSSRLVTIAEPLAFLSREKVLLQRGIPHRCTVKELLRSALASGDERVLTELDEVVSRTARGLAELHASGASAADTVTFEQEMRDVRSLIARLAAVAPGLENSADTLLATLESAAGAHPAQPPAPAHRSFRPAQVVIAGNRVGFIDFDGFCLAEPAVDVALFRAALLDTGVRALPAARSNGDATTIRPPDFGVLERLRGRFLDSYEDVAPISRARVAMWEVLYALTAALNCWAKVKFDRLAPRMALLLYQMRAGGFGGVGA